jgi:hypothetical protein
MFINKYIVYKAEISTSDGEETKKYIGMTAGTFKKRYMPIIKKSLNVPRYSAETELSRYAWKLKKSGKQYNVHQIENCLGHRQPNVMVACLRAGESLYSCIIL